MSKKSIAIMMVSLGFFAASSARAEYYIVYPASTAVAPCYSCAPPVVVQEVKKVRSYHAVKSHHYKRHYKPYRPHKHRSSVSMSVYYLVPPCGCAAPCQYYYQPCPDCRTVRPGSCTSGDCYVDTETTYNNLDRRTADDIYPDLQVTGD